ncbi:MAG: FAD binding domain-containing protein [Lachnospiraceae bacterium]|nr:FAD binding domain-containing protein [Lachnospiraceae bacterium]
MEFKKYIRASSLEEAWELNQKKQNRIAGGLMWLRLGKGSIDTLIDLGDLGLGGIEETNGAFRIGAMTTLRELELHEAFNAYCQGAARDAVRHIIGTQFRNMATVGGSIAGRFGFSDVLTLFLAMDTEVELFIEKDVDEIVRMPLAEYAKNGSGRDIVTALIVKKTPASYCYQSVRISESDFPVLAMAARRSADGKSWRFACGARPKRAEAVTLPAGLAAGLSGIGDKAGETGADKCGAETAAAITAAAEWLKDQFKTGSNMRGSAAYRTQLVGVLSERAIRDLTGEEASAC